MAHILASVMFSLIALALAGLIVTMLAQARAAIATALGVAVPDRALRYRAPMRVRVRRTATWSAPQAAACRAA